MADSTALSAGAIDAVAGLALQAAEPVEIDGVEYSPVPLHDPRRPAPLPDLLELRSLTALLRYISENRDELSLAECALHVESPVRVALVGALSGGHHRQRSTYVRANAHPAAADFGFGRFHDLESFNIRLQSLFTDDGQRDAVIRLVGNIKSEQVRHQSDDGRTQTVEARTGIATMATVNVPNPVLLAPYRTFLEVSQPLSLFVLRLREGSGGVQAALFEADGGAWRHAAMASVRGYLEAALADVEPRPCCVLA